MSQPAVNAPASASSSRFRLSDEQLRAMAQCIRGLAIDAVEAANSGHPGAPLGLADVAAVLWGDVMRFDPRDAGWRGRDRFVLSAGHASMLLYGALHVAGLDVSLDEIKRFRQLGARTAGHPERGELPGVETTTGPLGQGFANAVGMALGQRLLANRCPADDHGFTPANGRVFMICSDGDLMEGIASEALQLAGAWQLGNLVAIYDDNAITIDGSTSHAWVEDVPARFAANGWAIERMNGMDPAEVKAVLGKVAARADDPANTQPTLVVTKTVIGHGSPNKAGKASSHGAALGKDEARATKQALGLDPDQTYQVSDAVTAATRALADARHADADAWRSSFDAWATARPDAAAAWRAHFEPAAPDASATDALLAAVKDAGAGATRAHSGKVLAALGNLDPRFVGGSADLSGSNNSEIKGAPWVRRDGELDFAGRNVHFGVREHAGAAIANGLTLHGGFRGFFASFLVFADYCRPSIRLAALMKIPTVFIFSHDSIYVGEDGPTHQPIEQVWALRLIPGLRVMRPADALETALAWRVALDAKDGDGPIALITTRQKVPVIERDSGTLTLDTFARGGYVVRESTEPAATLVASGSEVALALGASDILASRGVQTRVASIPCVDTFTQQPADYRAGVLASALPVISIEAGVTGPWSGIIGAGHGEGLAIGIDTFGASGPGGEVAAHFGLTPQSVADRIKKHLR